MKNSAMTIRLDEQLRHEFMSYCKNNQLPASLVIRNLMKNFLNSKNYPISQNIPNATTLQSMSNTVQEIGVKSYDSMDNLFTDLGI